MSLLLDTHLLLWWLGDDPALSERHRALIGASDVRVFVSAISVWEIAIKRSLGKLESPSDLIDALRASGLATLSVNAEHAWVAGGLPAIHRDPFDRMLVAQAQVENMAIATVDPVFDRYEVAVV